MRLSSCNNCNEAFLKANTRESISLPSLSRWVLSFSLKLYWECDLLRSAPSSLFKIEIIMPELGSDFVLISLWLSLSSSKSFPRAYIAPLYPGVAVIRLVSLIRFLGYYSVLVCSAWIENLPFARA